MTARHRCRATAAAPRYRSTAAAPHCRGSLRVHRYRASLPVLAALLPRCLAASRPAAIDAGVAYPRAHEL